MARFVALLRGINVGRAKRVAMADLRSMLGGLGYGDVQTLLNSGNAVFNGPAKAPLQHARRIQAALAKELGVDALIIVKSAQEMTAIVAGNGLRQHASDPSRLLVAVTRDAASLALVRQLADTHWGDEMLHLGEHAAYLWCANGILESKAAVALLKGLADTGTTRNWATIEKIHALMQAPC